MAVINIGGPALPFVRFIGGAFKNRMKIRLGLILVMFLK
jgi:hypothetical protein